MVFQIIQRQKMEIRKNKSHRKSKETKVDETGKLEQSLYNKFMHFMSKQMINHFSIRLREYFKKNFLIAYQPSYNFREEWENQKIASYSSSEDIWKVNMIGVFTTAAIMLTYTACIWSRSIELFFALGESQPWQPVYILTLILQIPDAYLTILTHSQGSTENLSLKQRSRFLARNLFCLTMLVLMVTGALKHEFYLNFPLELINLCLLYKRASKIYGAFRLTFFALTYEYQLKALDLIMTLLIVVHLFAIALFQVSRLDYGQSWFDAIAFRKHSSLTRYIYSFYFGTSTIFTVGYGDLSPKNQVQVALLILVQCVGIVIIAYIINQIGYNVSAMRKDSEKLQKQLLLINKMKKYYKLDNQLINKARSYIIEEKPSIDHLLPQDQKALLQKFSEGLRNQIKSETTLSVVKSCIFFLCRWSKSMQTAVASRLNNVLFLPSEHIYQPHGKQRIYIIRLGTVDVFTQRKGNKKGKRTVLKTISSDLTKQVCDNTYGYTAVMSKRPVRLYGMSRDSTSAYYIDKQKFMECLGERVTDLEYFYEMVDKIDQQKNWQALEVPQIASSKHHYNPTHSFLIKRHNKILSKKTNQRTQNYKRGSKKQRVHVQNYKQMVKCFHTASLSFIDDQGLNSDEIQSQDCIKEQQMDQSLAAFMVNLAQKTERKLGSAQKTNFNSKGSKNHVDQENKSHVKQELLKQRRKPSIQQKQITNFLSQLNNIKKTRIQRLRYNMEYDLAKDYYNYFPKSNKDSILKQLELNDYFGGVKKVSDMAKTVSNYKITSNSNYFDKLIKNMTLINQLSFPEQSH